MKWSVYKLCSKKSNSPEFVLQRVFVHPKGVMLWPLKSIAISWERCQEDILYLDATGSIEKRRKEPLLFKCMNLLWETLKKPPPPPIQWWLISPMSIQELQWPTTDFSTDASRCFGKKKFPVPLMIMCDSSVFLVQAMCSPFAKKKYSWHTEPLLCALLKSPSLVACHKVVRTLRCGFTTMIFNWDRWLCWKTYTKTGKRRIETRTLHMQLKHSPTELHPLFCQQSMVLWKNLWLQWVERRPPYLSGKYWLTCLFIKHF